MDSLIRPRAYLRRIRNVRRGVSTRSKIIDHLIRKPSTTSELADRIGLSKSSIRRHLKNMSAERIVERFKFRGKIFWKLTGSGQMALEELLT